MKSGRSGNPRFARRKAASSNLAEATFSRPSRLFHSVRSSIPGILKEAIPTSTTHAVGTTIFDALESEVRSYCRSFPAVFSRAKGERLWDDGGREYVDFFAGAGALNYGHNPDPLKRRLLAYLEEDGILHSLDLHTVAKRDFLERFQNVILHPRGLNYRVMFPGPTGTNAVESALKIARKVTARHTVIAFTNAFHGMTLGALALSSNRFKRSGAGLPLTSTVHVPFDGYFGEGMNTVDYLERCLEDQGSGVSRPAAVILETVQGEGGVHVARDEWLRAVETVCRSHEVPLIVDDVQVGCGRTGPFFSFESSGIRPDIVCLSKSISGYGLPMALTLIRPDFDAVWSPGEHNGTFRGHNAAFVTATAALDFWEDDRLTRSTRAKGERVRACLTELAESFPVLRASVRGRGLIWGLELESSGAAEAVSREAFRTGLLIETSGAESQVVKCLPPLTISDEGLEEGLSRLAAGVAAVARAL